MIDVIMVCFNNLVNFERTFSSLEKIRSLDFRVIVVDSSIDDQIKDFLATSSSSYEVHYFWTPPKGVYNAMNLALRHAKPDSLVWFLNPGDMIFSGEGVSNLQSCIIAEANSWGCAQAIYQGSRHSFPHQEPSFFNVWSGKSSFSHQTMLVRGYVFTLLGGFNEDFRVAADLEFQLELLQAFSFSFAKVPIVTLDIDGLSHTSLLRTYWEAAQVRFRVREVSWIRALWTNFVVVFRRVFLSKSSVS
jgi:hypothetical protein